MTWSSLLRLSSAALVLACLSFAPIASHSETGGKQGARGEISPAARQPQDKARKTTGKSPARAKYHHCKGHPGSEHSPLISLNVCDRYGYPRTR